MKDATHLLDNTKLGEVRLESFILHILVHVKDVNTALVIFLVSSRLSPVNQDRVVLPSKPAHVLFNMQ